MSFPEKPFAQKGFKKVSGVRRLSFLGGSAEEGFDGLETGFFQGGFAAEGFGQIDAGADASFDGADAAAGQFDQTEFDSGAAAHQTLNPAGELADAFAFQQVIDLLPVVDARLQKTLFPVRGRVFGNEELDVQARKKMRDHHLRRRVGDLAPHV
jgi:hypothetical protein